MVTAVGLLCVGLWLVIDGLPLGLYHSRALTAHHSLPQGFLLVLGVGPLRVLPDQAKPTVSITWGCKTEDQGPGSQGTEAAGATGRDQTFPVGSVVAPYLQGTHSESPGGWVAAAWTGLSSVSAVFSRHTHLRYSLTQKLGTLSV